MRRGGKVFIFLGLILAVAAFVGIMLVMRGTPKKKEPVEVVTQKVVVAATDISARTKISAENVTMKEMPLNAVPPLAITDVVSVTNRIAVVDILADQVILQSMVAGEGMGGVIPALDIPAGMVAMAIPIDEISGVAEALRAGDRVDVIVSLHVMEYDQQGDESRPEYSAQFTIQDVEVLHIGSWAMPLPEESAQATPTGGLLGAGGSRSSSSTVQPLAVATLLLEPQDALVIKYALDTREAEGREAFTLVLRAVDDHEKYTTEAVNQDYMVKRFKFSRPPFIIHKPTMR